MTNFIPIFPLNIVVFPTENLNLHIFEPKYKQLIVECMTQQKEFGIPTVLNGKISDTGVLVKILSIEKEYANGELDIKTKGLKLFTILEIIKEIPDKLYSGAIVSYPRNSTEGIEPKMKKIIEEVKYFHELLDVKKDYKKTDDELSTYDIAHHVGMTLEQEYEFLNLLKENQRQEYIQRHLKKIIPTIEDLQHLKKRILLNGHFRKLSVNDMN